MEAKKRADAEVACRSERRRVVEVTPILEPGSTSRSISEQRRSSSAGERIDLQEEGGDERDGRGGRKKSKGKGKGRMDPVPEFSDVSSSPESMNSVSIENRVDRLVVAFIASKKCMNAESKRVMIQRFIREPALTHFSPVRAVHVSDVFIRNEDSAAKASRWNLAFVSTALFRLSKVIQQEEDDPSSKIRLRDAGKKILRFVHVARHKFLSEIEERKEKKKKEKEKTKKRIDASSGRKHHGLKFDRDKVY